MLQNKLQVVCCLFYHTFRAIDYFFAIFVAIAVKHYTILIFVTVNYKYII